MADSGVFLDTNVLLSASSTVRPLHGAALRVLNDWPNENRRLVVSGQVLREYLVVATRSEAQNGLGLGLASAIENVREFRLRIGLAEESRAALEHLLRLLHSVGSMGTQIHDANLVAAALAAGVTRLVTANPRDFERFGAEIEVIDLQAVGGVAG